MTTMRGTLDNHYTVVYCPCCDWRGILGASDAMDVLDPDGVKIVGADSNLTRRAD